MSDEWICGEPPVDADTDIESMDDVPSIECPEEFQEMLDEVERLVEDGDGLNDACIRVVEDDLQLYLLTQAMIRE